MATLTPSFAEFLPAWVAGRRWYAGKGRSPQLRRIGGFRLQDPAGEVGIDTHLVLDESGPEPVVYQVPLTYRSTPVDDMHTALVATAEHSELGTRYIYDGTADPVYVQALLDLVHSGGTAEADGDGDTDGEGSPGQGGATGQTVGEPGTRPVVVRSAVLTGEQSNTSIIVRTEGEDAPLIIKVFRVLHPGDNPDVAVQSALAATGSTLVPPPVGSVTGTWPDPTGESVTGHLAFVQEFLPGVEDAWRRALVAAGDDEDFAGPAEELGRATAQVHAALREAFGATPVDDAARSQVLDRMAARKAAALTEVPALAEHSEAIDALYAEAGQAPWPDLQRVHGDYHLGQVLDVPDRGWVLVDFEGEPLRALTERTAPDLALRDVAGMLRSFGYVSGTLAQERQLDRTGWTAACRESFLRGYRQEATGEPGDPDTDSVLLDALEVDKALYEVVYEARNRPTWVGIPVDAVADLLARRADTSRAAAAEAAPSSSAAAQSGAPGPAAAGAASAAPTAGTEGADSTDSTNSTDNGSAPGPAGETAGAEAGDAPGAGDADQDNGGDGPDSDGVGDGDGAEHRPAVKPLSGEDVERLVRSLHNDPHSVLGAHPYDGGVTVRALRPLAASVTVLLPGDERVPMEHETHGIWVAVLDQSEVTDYRLEVQWGDGVTHLQDEPYRFLPTLGQMDRHLFSEGRHEQLWEVLGAHIQVYDGPLGQVWGTSFAVWAPHARGVHVVGDFNQWDNSAHPMRILGSTGVWELFIPGVGEGNRYKFDITGPDGHRRLKADPMAQAAEVPPSSASIVTRSHHEWSEGDAEWLRRRAERDPHSGPMSVYEVHLASWRRGLSYRELADQLVSYVAQMGFTHVEFMPVMQHPYGPSWGYHVTGYYATDSRLGSPDDLRYLIDRLHQAGIGVILDWVPGHFATDPWALARFDGTPIYEHPDPRKGWHPEWGSYIFDFGRPEVRNFLVANALFWLESFHADGLRVDGVASMLYLDYSRDEGQWIPNRFGGRENLEAVALLQETNATAYKRTPGIVTIAEESTSWPGVTRPTDYDGLGFGFKWNMGWMHDSLDYVARNPIHRQYHHHQLTFSLMYAFSERFVLPISHDEVVHGKGSMLRKMAGDRWQQLANLRAYLAFMWSHPGKQLLFMGQEFAQESEWADGRSLDWWLLDQPAHVGVQHLVRDLNQAYRDTPALWELDDHPSGFQWLEADDARGNTFAYIRYGHPLEDGDRPVLVAVANFGGQPRSRVRVGLPRGGTWRELVNTDAHDYGGSGVGNLGQVHAQENGHQGQPFSVELNIPPLGVLWLVPEGPVDGEPESGPEDTPDSAPETDPDTTAHQED
ncbi:1,4-alpha-glucan branching protein GlgB [Ornithinicoccus hortensis]|uniref:1,4-alpha-glucan branching enzyme GlgB n=1 Tax=Ornithinicoccus hortensis TaxID=82346 RepID=A0A542YV44_9MICO|nr:1,4-alpha-glucan branching protein GlgB [Ornithinicoccus hortensis]TQL51951.1 1,4-alpha-glucan branching enzyme [Ornithinicoccus hortensis]